MSLQSEVTRLQGIKTNIRTALVNKGVSGAGSHNMADFATDIAGITTGTDVSDTTATASDVLSGKAFYLANGTKTNGTIASKSSSNLSVSGATVTAPAGYYPSNASKSVASGALSTPTVNSSGLVTASVGTSGYLASGTNKTLQLSTQSAKTVTPSTSSQTAVSSGKYTTGAVTVSAMPSGALSTPTVSSTGLVTASVGTSGYLASGTSNTAQLSPVYSTAHTVKCGMSYDGTDRETIIAGTYFGVAGYGPHVTIAQFVNGDIYNGTHLGSTRLMFNTHVLNTKVLMMCVTGTVSGTVTSGYKSVYFIPPTGYATYYYYQSMIDGISRHVNMMKDDYNSIWYCASGISVFNMSGIDYDNSNSWYMYIAD